MSTRSSETSALPRPSRWTSPQVVIPYGLSASIVFFPTPQSIPMGFLARKAAISSGSNGMRVSPSGLRCSDPIFASSLLGAIPTEQVTPQTRRISLRSASPSATARSAADVPRKRWSEPAMSRNASSTETPSTYGV